MNKASDFPRVRGARLPGGPAVVIWLALAVLAGTILAVTLRLRATIREQIAGRDGEELHAVALMRQLEEPEGGGAWSIEDPAEQMDLTINISRIKGVLGIRLFSPEGQFVNAFPAYISEAELATADLPRLRLLQPASHYVARGQLGEVNLLAEEGGRPVPLLIVNVPLHSPKQGRLAGVAQFILQGEWIAREYRWLDWNLAAQAGVVFLSGGILAAALVVAFRRLQGVNRLLGERTQSLLRANQELTLAAKSSALGAVTTHLIHGLKSPLSSLQSFMRNGLEKREGAVAAEWEEAIAMTRRMQNLIGEVVRILGEQEMEADYELSLAELAQIVADRAGPVAKAAGVKFSARAQGAGTLSSRAATLVLLILENLVQNAIEATPPGKGVWLEAGAAGEQALFEVRDEGPGLPEGMAGRLFAPCHSSKEGGSGLGLAISRQLALHLGAELELKRSTEDGCVFGLRVPLLRTAERV